MCSIIYQFRSFVFCKCGEICDMDFVANFMENATVKKSRISVNICQTHERIYNGTVFIETRCKFH